MVLTMRMRVIASLLWWLRASLPITVKSTRSTITRGAGPRPSRTNERARSVGLLAVVVYQIFEVGSQVKLCVPPCLFDAVVVCSLSDP